MNRLLCLLALLLPVAAWAEQPLPEDSVYQLPVTLTTQNGDHLQLAERRGRPQLLSMFYTTCQMVCPVIIDSQRMTHEALDPAQRERIDLLAVSFDPARDDVAALRAYVQKRKLDPRFWTLARPEPGQERPLSSVLGVQYRKLPDGDFNHSSELILLDADGRIVARTDKMGRPDPDFVAAIKKLLGGA